MQVRVQGVALPPLRSRKALWILALLTLRHGRPVEREWLAGTLWPDADQSQSFGNLRPAVSDLRRALGSQSDRLQSPDRHSLLLDLSSSEVDLLAFDAAIAVKSPASLEQAVSLYRGPLLEGCSEEWVFQDRAVREQNCLQALQELAAAALTAGDYTSSVALYRRAISMDPWWDAVRRGCMLALEKSGDTNAALQVYREFVNELGNDPSAAPDDKTSELYNQLRAQARKKSGSHYAQPTSAAQATPIAGYLPVPLTDLVGREDERIEIIVRLRRSRLVTLTGIGGVGKTRLATAVAGEVRREFADGVWFIGLEAIIESTLVIQHVASILGVRGDPGRTLLLTLAEYIGTKRLLLVLDNCEHVLTECAQLAANLLQHCNNLRVLATSRETLGITGEVAWRVPSLAVPDPAHLPQGRSTLLRVLMSYDGVLLFLERARAVRESFALDAGNALHVAQICSQLDGIPLAIELAAAQMKVLTAEQLALRLGQHLDLLTGGSRTAQVRQQTMKATLDWSYSMLDETEKLLLRRLSVFVGGWGLEAAEAICAGQQLAEGQILGMLTSLVSKSLVVYDDRNAAVGGRYRLFEVMRQYASGLLNSGDDAITVKARHFDWYMKLAKKLEVHFEPNLPWLDAEYGNLRSAVAWSETSSVDAETGLHFVSSLWGYWFMRGLFLEGRDCLGRALERCRQDGPTQLRAKALLRMGTLCRCLGDNTAARSTLEESVSINVMFGNKLATAHSLNNLANLNSAVGDYDSAYSQLETSLSIFREIGNIEGRAWSLCCMGNELVSQGEYARARHILEESLSIRRELGHLQSIGASLTGLGTAIQGLGDYISAQVLLEESLLIQEELGDRQAMAGSIECLGTVACHLGEHDRAQARFEESLRIFTELGYRHGIATSLLGLGGVANSRHEHGNAECRYRESLRISTELGERPGIAAALNGLGKAASSQGDYSLAIALCVKGLALCHSIGRKVGVADGLKELAVTLLAQSDAQKAVYYLGASHALRETIMPCLPLNELHKFEQHITNARMMIGDEDCMAAFELGCVTPCEQVIEAALGLGSVPKNGVGGTLFLLGGNVTDNAVGG